MKRLALLLLLLVSCAGAQQYRSAQVTSFTNVATGATLNLTSAGVSYHNIIWTGQGVIDSHATEMPTDPGVANVKTGTTYGSFTGTLNATGGQHACSYAGD